MIIQHSARHRSAAALGFGRSPWPAQPLRVVPSPRPAGDDAPADDIAADDSAPGDASVADAAVADAVADGSVADDIAVDGAPGPAAGPDTPDPVVDIAVAAGGWASEEITELAVMLGVLVEAETGTEAGTGTGTGTEAGAGGAGEADDHAVDGPGSGPLDLGVPGPREPATVEVAAAPRPALVDVSVLSERAPVSFDETRPLMRLRDPLDPAPADDPLALADPVGPTPRQARARRRRTVFTAVLGMLVVGTTATSIEVLAHGLAAAPAPAQPTPSVAPPQAGPPPAAPRPDVPVVRAHPIHEVAYSPSRGRHARG